MDTILLRIVQAGLNEKYRIDELEKAAKSSRVGKGSSSPVAPLGLEELIAPILLILILHSFNILVFILGRFSNILMFRKDFLILIHFRVFYWQTSENEKSN